MNLRRYSFWVSTESSEVSFPSQALIPFWSLGLGYPSTGGHTFKPPAVRNSSQGACWFSRKQIYYNSPPVLAVMSPFFPAQAFVLSGLWVFATWLLPRAFTSHASLKTPTVLTAETHLEPLSRPSFSCPGLFCAFSLFPNLATSSGHMGS